MLEKLDKTDIEILRLLQQNSNRTIKNIADFLGMALTGLILTRVVMKQGIVGRGHNGLQGVGGRRFTGAIATGE